MKVHLVDGTFELFRAFYGAPAASSPDGREVGATRGLMRSLHGLTRQPDVTHVAVAFDTVIESFRNQLFEGYKTGEGIEPALHSQFPIAEQAIAALGIVVWSMIDFEADDALAAGAAKYQGEVEQVVLCSPDKDLAQCVESTHIVCFDRLRRKLLDEAGVEAKFGVGPRSIPDYLALVGDSADGIPGIARWGAKSAGAVLSHYKHIEAIPDDPGQWPMKVRGAAKLAENLSAEREAAMLYRKLATLRTDVPLQQSLQELRYTGPSTALREFCEQIGEDSARYL